MESIGRSCPKAAGRTTRTYQMVSDFQDNVRIVPAVWAKWQTVQIKVGPLILRYHNHLDCSINNADWSPEEERLLFEMQE